MGINATVFEGRLTADPVLVKTTTGKAVCNFILAVDKARKDTTPDFFRCSAWNQPAEYLCKYGRRGTMISVLATAHQDDYTDKQGVKHLRVTFEVDKLHILVQPRSATPSDDGIQPAPPVFSEDNADDENLPF